MYKTLSKTKTDKFDKIILDSFIYAEAGELTKEEKVELKSYAINKVVKIGKFIKQI